MPRLVWALGSAAARAKLPAALSGARGGQDVDGDGRVSLAEWMVFELDLVDRMAAAGQSNASMAKTFAAVQAISLAPAYGLRTVY